MIFFGPRGVIASQKRQEAATMQFGARGFDEKGAATARSDDPVDFLD